MVRLQFTAVIAAICLAASQAEQPVCSWSSDHYENVERDPALKPMKYDVGDGEKTFWAYVEPNVTTFYTNGGLKPPASTKVTPKFNGFATKFVNLSNKNLRLYWEAHAGATPNLMRYYKPFSTGGTASFPGHRFFFALEEDPDNRVESFIVGNYPDNYYVYDPFTVEGDSQQTEENLKVLKPYERELYDKWIKTLKFDEQYKAFTGRSYLANYGRKPPMHFMWRADYFGQEQWVTSKETHFLTVPPAEKLGSLSAQQTRALKDDEPRTLAEYRDPAENGILNMTLKVLSCAPRAFEIENFLSPAEVQHIIKLASGIDLKLSSTGDVTGDRQAQSKPVKHTDTAVSKTRTSFNSWVPRHESPIIDAIYRRSADLMRIDEALLRYRHPHEFPDHPTKRTISESLQLVHYDKAQEYTAHHDFGYPRVDDPNQGARFATLLLYLNSDMTGGETSFPRWVNAESFDALKVKPKAGKAVLFYSQLPDGNMDDFSQHAALPIKSGEKWLINLWTWEPVYEK